MSYLGRITRACAALSLAFVVVPAGPGGMLGKGGTRIDPTPVEYEVSVASAAHPGLGIAGAVPDHDGTIINEN